MELGKIYIRSLVGIVSISAVTYLSGVTDLQTMAAYYIACLGMVYLDKDLSGEVKTSPL
jgi:hypothetical protein